MFIVKYYGDPSKLVDIYDSESNLLTEINEQKFDSIFEAIKFLSNCNKPITTIDELLPDIKKIKNFKFILSEKSIKVKHQIFDSESLASMFDNEDEDWG